MDDELLDFFTHPAWRRVQEVLDLTIHDYKEQAAREPEEHLRKLGRLEGAEHLLGRLHALRRDGK